jgi:hypothetical protein
VGNPAFLFLAGETARDASMPAGIADAAESLVAISSGDAHGFLFTQQRP